MRCLTRFKLNPSKYKYGCAALIACIVIYIVFEQREDRSFLRWSARNSIRQDSCTYSGNQLNSATRRYVVFDSSRHIDKLDFLNNPPTGWSVLVFNAQTPEQMTSCSSCTFLSCRPADGQEAVGSSLLASKMAAYLSVVSMKPEWIYVTNRVHGIPWTSLARVVDSELTTSITPNQQSDLFEPCHHFVDPITWYGRRDLIKPQERYSLKNVERQSVYQVVDACFHPDLTEQRWKASLDQRAPLPFLFPGTYGVGDFNNMLVSMETAWTLVAALPDLFMTSGEVNLASVQLNFAVQRILWETKSQLAFIPGPPHMKQCSTCIIHSFIEKMGSKFRENLTNWRCKSTHGVDFCLKEVVSTILDNGVYIDIVDKWVQSFENFDKLHSKRNPITSAKLFKKGDGTQLYFSPPSLVRNAGFNSDLNYPFNTLTETCKKGDKVYQGTMSDIRRNENMIALIIINELSFVYLIPLLEYLYGRFFSHIIYCSGTIDKFDQFYMSKNPHRPISFVVMEHSLHTQVCTMTAIKMNYDTLGYFQFSDDVLVNIWNYQTVPLHQPWFQAFIGSGNVTSDVFAPGNGETSNFATWEWFKSRTRMTWRHLQTLSKDPILGERVSRFLNTIADGTGCSDCIYFGNADIFYIPQRIAKDFVYFSDIFDLRAIHFELTIINVMGGLVPRKEIYPLSGMYAWGGARNNYRSNYKSEHHFYHAWKMSGVGNPQARTFFCEEFVRRLDEYIN